MPIIFFFRLLSPGWWNKTEADWESESCWLSEICNFSELPQWLHLYFLLLSTLNSIDGFQFAKGSSDFDSFALSEPTKICCFFSFSRNNCELAIFKLDKVMGRL